MVDISSFNKSNINNLEMITYFEDINHKSEKKLKNHTTRASLLESVETVILFASKTTSVSSTLTGVDLIVVPISAAIACALSLGNKVLHNIILNEKKKYKKQLGKDQQTI